MEMSRLTRDGTAEPVSRNQILRHEREQGNIHFSCSADHVQDWQPDPVDPYHCYMCDHTLLCMVEARSVHVKNTHTHTHCRESTGTGPTVLKIIPVTGAASSGMTVTMDQLICASLFLHPLDYWHSGHVRSRKYRRHLLVRGFVFAAYVPPKRFDISPPCPESEGCSEGLDSFRFFFNYSVNKYLCGKTSPKSVETPNKNLGLVQCTKSPVAPVAQRYHVTSDTLEREFDPGKRDFSH